MVAIVTRAGKGSPLTNAEVDANFVNLNSGKLETSNNLSDLADAAAARTNLGLGSLATLNSITSLMVTDALGFTPANKDGDTFSGVVNASVGLGIGTSSLNSNSLRIAKTLTGAASTAGVTQFGQVQSDVTTQVLSFNSQINTVAASFTLTDYVHYYAQQGTLGAGSTVSTQTGFYAHSSMTSGGAGAVYGFRGGLTANANRWNLYMDGTAQNYLGGATILNAALGLGAAGSPSYGTSGQVLTSAGPGAVPTWSTPTGGVTSFNTRTGAITLTSGDVTTALGFTPYNSSNPSGFITSSGSISGNAATASNAAKFDSSVRCYSREWIEMPNYTGLYSPLNGAHFYPNNASYGSWRIAGTRNGWYGIEFDSGTSLMMNNDTHGFHRNIGGGWRFYNESGNGYFPGNVTAYWSDERLKENLRKIDREALTILGQMSAFRFNWNSKVAEIGNTIPVGKEEIGLIAQHVQRALSDAVVVNKAGAKIGEVDFDYLTINYDRITPLLVEAVNIHESDVNDLKTTVDRLSKAVQELLRQGKQND